MLFGWRGGGGGGGGKGQGPGLPPAPTSFSMRQPSSVGEGSRRGLATPAFGAVTAFSQELQTRRQQGHGSLKQLLCLDHICGTGRLIKMGCITSKQLGSITGQELKSTEEPSNAQLLFFPNSVSPLWSVQHSLWMKCLRQGWC